jgi:PRC-barrel domain
MVAEVREIGNLIGSDKVEGTAVYGPNDLKVGFIERVMIDKKSGKVSYAVLSFGGFLHWRRPLPAALAVVEIRHAARRISDRRHAEAARRCAQIR